VVLGANGLSFADEKGKGAHRHYKGEVVEKAGSLAIKDETGSTYSLSEKEAGRQGREFKVGDKVDFTVNENNTLIDVYPAPLEIETTPTTWSGADRGGGHGARIDRAN
jgi:hypothetical protein